MDELQPMLDLVFAAVQSHLEAVRQANPRLYFVDDRSLLPCLGQHADQSDVLVALRQCSAWSSLEFGAPKQLAAVLAGGQRLALSHLIHLPGSLSSWIKAAVDAVASGLQLQQQLAISSLHNENPLGLEQYVPPKRTRRPRGMSQGQGSRLQSPAASSSGALALKQLETESLLAWVEQFPTQAVLLAVRIHATQQLTDVLTGPRQERRHGLKQLMSTYEQRRLSLQTIEMGTGLSNTVRARLAAATTALLETEQLLGQLTEKKVLRSDDALWMLAPKWQQRAEVEGYVVQLGLSTHQLGSEFYGHISLVPWTGSVQRLVLQLSTLGNMAAHSVAHGETTALHTVHAWSQSCGW
jgi:hypothetical protein